MNEVLSAERLAREAKRAYQSGDYDAAARGFMAAAESYQAGGDPLTAAEMANNGSVAFLQAGNPQAALESVAGTETLFLKAGDVRRQATALGNRGAALEALDRFDEAVDVYQQSAELFKQIGDDEMRVSVIQSLSALQLRTGRQLEALATMRYGLEDVRRPTVQQRVLKRLLRVPFKMLESK